MQSIAYAAFFIYKGEYNEYRYVGFSIHSTYYLLTSAEAHSQRAGRYCSATT